MRLLAVQQHEIQAMLLGTIRQNSQALYSELVEPNRDYSSVKLHFALAQFEFGICSIQHSEPLAPSCSMCLPKCFCITIALLLQSVPAHMCQRNDTLTSNGKERVSSADLHCRASCNSCVPEPGCWSISLAISLQPLPLDNVQHPNIAQWVGRAVTPTKDDE